MPVSADAPADGAGSEAHEGEAGPTASDTSSSVPAEGDIQPDEKPPADAPLAPLPGSPSVPSTAEVPSEANPANLPSAQNQPAPPEISFPVALQYPAGDMHSGGLAVSISGPVADCAMNVRSTSVIWQAPLCKSIPGSLLCDTECESEHGRWCEYPYDRRKRRGATK